MKTKALLLLCAILALAACSKEDNIVPLTPTELEQPTPTEPVTPITFNLTATRPGDAATTRGSESGGWRWQSWDDDEPADAPFRAMTRVGKQDWEEGDAIFVFFHKTGDEHTGVSVPVHLKMTYDGTRWTSVEYDGETPSPGRLSNELYFLPTGKMTAVYLPYGSNATVSATGEPDEFGRYHSFKFSEAHYAYYMTATLPYTVIDNTVSGAFDMKIADGFVQFFVKDDGADQDVDCLLGIDAIVSVDISSIGDDGTITETSDKMYWEDLPGFYYNDGNVSGYLFYGKLDANYYESGYYFAMIKPNSIYENNNDSGDEYDRPSGNNGNLVIRDLRYDYYARDKTLASHDAIRLPDADNINRYKDNGLLPVGKWIEVGENITVKLQNIADNGTITDLGTWYTCNYNRSAPEIYGLGDNYTYPEAMQLPVSYLLPRTYEFDTLRDGCTWTHGYVHGGGGRIGLCDTGFLFLPSGIYWPQDQTGTTIAYFNEEVYTLRPEEVAEGAHAGVRCIVR